jgi:glyoxylase I family protein
MLRMSQAPEKTPTLKALPLRLHHHAYTTDDLEATRHFYEDILGIPLIATWIEKEHLGGEWVELGHSFYGLADGSALAFFNFADPKKQAAWKAKEQSLFVHLALAVSKETQDEIKGRLKKADFQTFDIDHGYCYSMYVRDPNGLLVEFTVDPPHVQTINAVMRKSAHQELQRWIAGGRESNNTWREHIETEAPV